ncbi:MAG: hypothetical protein L0387_41150 [Acidobacteria bacterium]|nr:hypothetical protein [Acidobacteriota bacterium]MCI0722225.1 hypothetical protein [Acidobacteriota bacterium]
MNAGDRLLYALSARRHMSWAAVKHAFDCLHETDDDPNDGDSLRYRRGYTVRVLDSLGHVEFDARPQQLRVIVTPPTIAVLPWRGLPTGVLTGARSPASVGQLSAAAKRFGVLLDVHCQISDPQLHPSRISVVTEDLAHLTFFAREQGVHCTEFPAAWSLLHVAGSLDDYLGTLKPEGVGDLNWEREDFDPEALCFNVRLRQDKPLLSRYTHPTRRTRLHVLHQAEMASPVDPDWGRFAILQAARRDVLTYGKNSSLFCVPATTPLPKLLERSLCLCSGWAPAVANGIVWPGSRVSSARVYQHIPVRLAETIADKLGQRLSFRELPVCAV